MNLPTEGTHVRTKKLLGDTRGMSIAPEYLLARRTDKLGTYRGWVPGHGGDVWWIEHDDKTIAAYTSNEVTIVDRKS